MKTKTKRTDKNVKKSGSSRTSTGRGVNTDEQKRVINAPTDDDEVENRADIPGDDVEDEEDREKRRKVEDEGGE